jgi:hypothetical protein
MNMRTEKQLISALMLDLSNSLKWKLDVEPIMARDLGSLPASIAKLSLETVSL